MRWSGSADSSRTERYPTINVIDENLVFQTYTNRGANDAFAYLVALGNVQQPDSGRSSHTNTQLFRMGA